MAKIKVHTANFPYLEMNASGGCLFIKTGLMQMLGEAVHGSKISTIDIATEDTVQKVGGTIGWGVVGSLPIAQDAIVASWETFVELGRRAGWIVEHKDDFAAKISTLLA